MELKPYKANKWPPSSHSSQSGASSDTSLRTSLSLTQGSSWSSVSVSACNQNQDHTIRHLSLSGEEHAGFLSPYSAVPNCSH